MDDSQMADELELPDSPQPPEFAAISNKDMEGSFRRLEEKLLIMQLYSQIDGKCVNTYCIRCRCFFRDITHKCNGTANREFEQQFGGIQILSKEFIQYVLNVVKEKRAYYRAAQEDNIREGPESPEQAAVAPGISEFCDRIDRRDLPHSDPIQANETLCTTIEEYWLARIDLETLGEALPMKLGTWIWVCFTCLKLHETHGDPCILRDECVSIQDFADSRASDELNEEIKGQFISEPGVLSKFFEFAKNRLAHYRLVRRLDYSENKNKYKYNRGCVNDSDDDFISDTEVEPKEEEKTAGTSVSKGSSQQQAETAPSRQTSSNYETSGQKRTMNHEGDEDGAPSDKQTKRRGRSI